MKFPKNEIFLSPKNLNFTVIWFFVLFAVNTLYLDKAPLIWIKSKHCNLLEKHILQKSDIFYSVERKNIWYSFSIGSSSYNQTVTFHKNN